MVFWTGLGLGLVVVVMKRFQVDWPVEVAVTSPGLRVTCTIEQRRPEWVNEA
jgi:hypothetical protein